MKTTKPYRIHVTVRDPQTKKSVTKTLYDATIKDVLSRLGLSASK